MSAAPPPAGASTAASARSWAASVWDALSSLFASLAAASATSSSASAGAPAGQDAPADTEMIDMADESVFGMPLARVVAAAPSPAGLPAFIHAAIATLDAYGLDADGLYRENGWVTSQRAVVASLSLRFVAANPVVAFLIADSPHLAPVPPLPHATPVSVACIHTLASLVKRFLRLLPDPLITPDVAAHAAALAHPPSSHPADPPDLSWAPIAALLPPDALLLLSALFSHLARVEAHAATNRMSRMALVRVFSMTFAVSPPVITGLLILGAASPGLPPPYDCDLSPPHDPHSTTPSP